MANEKPPIVITSYASVVGAILAVRRKSIKVEGRSLTQSDMAKALDITVSTWSRIEKGETALTIEQLALAADVLIDEPGNILSTADKKVKELNTKGIETSALRQTVSMVTAAGAIPMIGSGLVGVIGPIAMGVAGAAVVSLFSKSLQHTPSDSEDKTPSEE